MENELAVNGTGILFCILAEFIIAIVVFKIIQTARRVEKPFVKGQCKFPTCGCYGSQVCSYEDRSKAFERRTKRNAL
jgi:hypothetical protein